jgi:hypothetical protein
MTQKRLLCLVAGLLVIALGAPESRAQSVLQRKRLGNDSEQITAIRLGPLARTIAILDGTDVLAFSNEGKGTTPPRKLFSVLGLGMNIGARGIAYSDVRQRFVFDDPTQINTLFLADNNGNAQGTINITRLGGFTPDHVEGLVWLPPAANSFANDIVEAAISFGNTTTTRLEVIDPSTGNVVAEIFPQIFASDPDPFDFITGVGFKSPDRFLVGTVDGALWPISLNGNPLGGPITFPGVSDLEGVTQVDSNRIAVASYDAGKVMFLDGNLNPLVGQDRSYLIGFGLSVPRGVAWNTDAFTHLVGFQGTAAPATAEQVISVDLALRTEHRVVDLTGVATPTTLSYLPDEHRIAVAQRACFPSCVILLYDNSGTLVDQVPVGLNLVAMAYIPTTKQFVGTRPGLPTTLLFFSRTGGLVNTIDVSGTGIDAVTGIAFFNPSHPSGGEFLLLSSVNTHQAFVVDFTGGFIQQFDYKDKLGVVTASDVGSITTGPLAGAFSIVSSDTSELVVFRLP